MARRFSLYFRAMCDKIRAKSNINLPRSKIIYLKREIHDGYERRSLSVIPRSISRRWFSWSIQFYG